MQFLVFFVLRKHRFYSCVTEEKMNAFSRFLVSYLMDFVCSLANNYILKCTVAYFAYRAHFMHRFLHHSSPAPAWLSLVSIQYLFKRNRVKEEEEEEKNNVHVYQKTCLTDENRYRFCTRIRMISLRIAGCEWARRRRKRVFCQSNLFRWVNCAFFSDEQSEMHICPHRDWR